MGEMAFNYLGTGFVCATNGSFPRLFEFFDVVQGHFFRIWEFVLDVGNWRRGPNVGPAVRVSFGGNMGVNAVKFSDASEVSHKVSCS